MATMWNTFPIKFQGGLITNLGRLEHGIQAPGSATVMRNFEPSIQGGYSKILGYSKLSPNEVPGTGQVVGAIVAGPGRAIAVRGNRYYTTSGAGFTQRLIAPLGIITQVRHDRFNFDGVERIVMVDGLNPPCFYNSSTDLIAYNNAAPAEVLASSIVRVFKNQVFFAKNNLLTFTAPFEENNFLPGDGAGTINIGSEITGLVVFREQLIIFAVDRIMRLTGNTSDDFLLQPIADKTGCLIHESIQEIGGDILYLGPDGVRFLSATEKNNDFGLERASNNIQTEVTNMIKTNARFCSTVVRAKNQYRIFNFVGNVAAKDTFSYLATKFSDQSTDRIEWAEIGGIKVYAIDSRQFGEDEYIIFCSDTGYLYYMENGNSFDGEQIEAIFETPFMPVTDPRIRKTCYKHTVYATVKGLLNLVVALRLDYRASGIIQPPAFTITSASSEGLYGEGVYGQTTFSAPARVQFTDNLVGSGFTMAFRYYDKSTNPSFNLDYAVLEFRENERR